MSTIVPTGWAVPAWKDAKDLILDWKVGENQQDGVQRLSKIHNFSRNVKLVALVATIAILVSCILSGGILALAIGGVCAALTYDIYRTLDNLQQLAVNEVRNWPAEADKGERVKAEYEAMTPQEKQDRRDRAIADLCRGTGLLRLAVGCYFRRFDPEVKAQTPPPSAPEEAGVREASA